MVFKRSKPLFSVLLPTHNRADILSFAIESVLAQTIGDFELLVVGDGCTDQTAEIILPYLKDNRVKWFDLPKAPGFGYANRNVALKQARGDYVAYIGHDDLLLPDHLELLSAPLDRFAEIDIAYSRTLFAGPTGQILPSFWNLHEPRMLLHFLHWGNEISASCIAHRRSLFERVDYWNDKLPHSADHDMWRRIILSAPHDNFYFETRPTALHFKANWREEFLPEKVGASAVISNTHHLEPIKYDVSEYPTEQEAIWRNLSNAPEQWTENLRAKVSAFTDGCCQYEHFHLIQERNELRTENIKLRDMLAAEQGSFAHQLRSVFHRAAPKESRRYKAWQKIRGGA